MPKYLVPVKIMMYGLAMVTADSASGARNSKMRGSMIIADSANSGSFDSIQVMQLKAVEVPGEVEDELGNYDNDGGVGGVISILEENGVDVHNWRDKIG